MKLIKNIIKKYTTKKGLKFFKYGDDGESI